MPFTYSKTFVLDASEAQALVPPGVNMPDPLSAWFEAAQDANDARRKALSQAVNAATIAGVGTWQVYLQVAEEEISEASS